MNPPPSSLDSVLFLPPGSSFAGTSPPDDAYIKPPLNVGLPEPPPIVFIAFKVELPNFCTAPLLITNSPGANIAGTVSLFGPPPGTIPPRFNSNCGVSPKVF